MGSTSRGHGRFHRECYVCAETLDLCEQRNACACIPIPLMKQDEDRLWYVPVSPDEFVTVTRLQALRLRSWADPDLNEPRSIGQEKSR